MEGLPYFEYHRPSSVEEAVGLLGEYGEDAKPMAGGTDLLIQMKNRWASPRHLIALKWIPGLDGIADGERVRGRKVFCQVAARKLGHTGASVAWFLGMTTSSVNRLARLEEMTDLDAWDK